MKREQEKPCWRSCTLVKEIKKYIFSIFSYFFLFLTLSIALSSFFEGCSGWQRWNEMSAAQRVRIFLFHCHNFAVGSKFGIWHFSSHLTKSGQIRMWHEYEWRPVSLISLRGWWYLGLLRGRNLDMLDLSQRWGTESRSVVAKRAVGG